MVPRIILDTNVLVSALRSRRGASFKVLTLIGRNLFQLSISVPLVLEYESTAKRVSKRVGLTYSDIDDIVDYICKVAEHRDIYYLWRPFLKDPKDDMVLEVAVESESEFIVTHNVRDFTGIEQFGLEAIVPKQLLEKIGEIS
jgi:putative PIN family toxin of toxin-antitoxin system